MVVSIESHNVTPVLGRHNARGWNTTVTGGVGVGATGRREKQNGTTREGHPGQNNSTEATTRPSQVPARDSTRFFTLLLAPTPSSSLLKLSESTRRISAPSSTTSSRRTQSSGAVRRSSTAQNTIVVPISTPAFTMFAVSGRTSSTRQRPTSSTATLSRSIPTLVPQLENSSAVPAAQSASPFPGRNQSKPTLDAAAVVSLLQPAGAQSSAVFITSQPLPPLQTSLTSRIFSTTIQTSSSAPLRLSSIATLPSFLSPTSFVTLTKSQRGKEQASNVPSALSTSEPVSITQTVSTLLASTLLATSMATAPTAPRITLTTANGQSQRGGRLTPLARTLFIVLGALGQYTQPRIVGTI
jgi:hypothetical protein